jgi:hypothetical protein
VLIGLYIAANHLKVLIHVGSVIIVVANVKYAHVSPSIPTVNIQYGVLILRVLVIQLQLWQILFPNMLVYISLHYKIYNLIFECNIRSTSYLNAISNVAILW